MKPNISDSVLSLFPRISQKSIALQLFNFLLRCHLLKKAKYNWIKFLEASLHILLLRATKNKRLFSKVLYHEV